MRFFILFFSFLILGHIYSQSLLFGVFYSLPYSTNAEMGNFKHHKFEISKNTIIQYDVDDKLKGKISSENKTVISIDTIINSDSLFYFIFKEKYKYKYILVSVKKNDYDSPICVNDNGYKRIFITKTSLLEEIKNDTIRKTFFPLYSKKYVQKLPYLKSIKKIDCNTLSSILTKMKTQRLLENSIYNNLTMEQKEIYYLNRYHKVSHLYHFIKEGYSPYIVNSDWDFVKQKFKNTKVDSNFKCQCDFDIY